MRGLKRSRGRFCRAYYSLAIHFAAYEESLPRVLVHFGYDQNRIFMMARTRRREKNLNHEIKSLHRIAGDTVILSRMYLFPSMSSISSRVLSQRVFHVHDSPRSQWHRYQRIFLYRVLSRVQVCNSKNNRSGVILFVRLTENVSVRT